MSPPNQLCFFDVATYYEVLSHNGDPCLLCALGGLFLPGSRGWPATA